MNKLTTSEHLLKVKNLTVTSGGNILVDKLSFEIGKGEFFGIIGQSGSGKSLTAYSVTCLIRHLGGLKTKGEVWFQGENLFHKYEHEMRDIRGNNIGMIFQDPMTSLNPLHTIGRQIEEAILLHRNLKKKKLQKEIAQLLDKVELEGLQDRLDAYPHELSGGQKQRVMIAIAIANNPKLIIADEATTALDVTVQREILMLLKKLQNELGLSILFISHDLNVVKHLADRVLVMCEGKKVEMGLTADIFKNPQEEYTKKLIESEPNGHRTKDHGNETILTAERLRCYYKVGKSFFRFKNNFLRVVDRININLKKGQTIGIIGESGSGKSTVAKAITKLGIVRGKIMYDGINIARINEREFKKYRKEIQIVFQDPYSSLNPRMTVEDIIAEGLLAQGQVDEKDNRKKISQVLEDVQLGEKYRTRYPHEMSGGEKQRVSLARSIILNPKILILDEPTSALDLITQKEILSILLKLQKERGMAYIFISHDLKVVNAISHYIMVMKDGKVVEEGNSDEIILHPREEYTKKLLSAAFV